MTKYKSIEGMESYEIEAWINQLGSMPKKVLKSGDYSGSYEMDCARVVELENGQFAFITESGCSCYDTSDADIELKPNEKEALKAFDDWERTKKGKI